MHYLHLVPARAAYEYAGSLSAHHCNRTRALVANGSGAGTSGVRLTAALDDDMLEDEEEDKEDEDGYGYGGGCYGDGRRNNYYDDYDIYDHGRRGCYDSEEYDSEDGYGMDMFDTYGRTPYYNRTPQKVNPWAHANDDVFMYSCKNAQGVVQPMGSGASSTAIMQPLKLQKLPIQDAGLATNAIKIGNVDFPVAVNILSPCRSLRSSRALN
jgi:hypothetical protein